MSLLINATAVSSHLSGIGRYALEVTRGLLEANPTAHAWVCKGGEQPLQDLKSQVHSIPSHCAPQLGPTGHLRRLAWAQGLSTHSWLKQSDVLFACSPLELAIHHPRQVVTVHDLTPLHFPKQHRLQSQIYRHVLPGLLRHCRGVIVPSNHTRCQVLETWDLDPSMIEVIPHGVSDVFLNKPIIPTRRPHDKPYLLWVGRAHPTKNLPMAVKIHSLLKKSGYDLDLLMTGNRPRWLDLPPETKASIFFLGGVNDLHLRDLYYHAETLLLPSWNEGFGLTALEALACGCPVVGTNQGALPEMNEPYIFTFPPENAEEGAILTECAMKKKKDASLSKETESYNWKKSALMHDLFFNKLFPKRPYHKSIQAK